MPRLYSLLSAALCFALLAGSVRAAPYPNVYGAPPEALRSSDWYRQCLRVKTLPAASMPAPTVTAPLKSGPCDAGALYYETLQQADAGKAEWDRVHACAVRSAHHGVLMMLYANGAGMTPRFDLALQHACRIQSPVAEMQSRVAHLQRRARGEERAPIDVCDDASTDLRTQCAAQRTGRRDSARAAQLASLARGWTQKEQLGLDMASKAAHYFAQHRAEHETDTGSAASGSLQLEVQAAELDQFADDVIDAEAGKAPRFSEAQFAVLEEKMTGLYRQFMLTRPVSQHYLGTIGKTGVEKTQRAWLAYRDAMELFGSIRHPQVPGSGWRAQLTARRLKQLTELDNAAAGR